MYARSASLAAAHVIGPDANEVLKAQSGGNDEEERCKGGTKQKCGRGMDRQLGVRAGKRKQERRGGKEVRKGSMLGEAERIQVMTGRKLEEESGRGAGSRKGVRAKR